MKKLIYILLLSLVVIGCSTESVEEEIGLENTAPSKPVLVTPANNELCTETELNLQWQASIDGEGDVVKYLLQVATDAGFSNIFHESTISQTSKELTFDKSKNYYWRVKASDTEQASSEFSSVYNFYSEGVGVENHVPFSPELVAPAQGVSITSGSIKLEWTATDLDAGDVLSYEVFVGTESDVLQSEASNLTDKFHTVTLNSANTYYWRVDVKDGNGGVTLGQVWKFTTL